MVGNCKKITRDAFEANENVTNIADRRTVRNDLINETVAYLKGIFKEDNLSTFYCHILKIIFDLFREEECSQSC